MSLELRSKVRVSNDQNYRNGETMNGWSSICDVSYNERCNKDRVEDRRNYKHGH